MNKSTKTVFACQACGYQAPKWMGKCPGCGEWDSLVEEVLERAGPSASLGRLAGTLPDPVSIDAVDIEEGCAASASRPCRRICWWSRKSTWSESLPW